MLSPLLRTTCILLSVLSTAVVARAQQFGGTPPSVKWQQINTDTARIIFPAGLDSIAQRMATLVHEQVVQDKNSLGKKLKKINIVLQNQTTLSNGYVGLGPYRSEFYLTPSLQNFDQGTLPWADLLAIHEYRHVQQFNNFRKGISKTMGVLFGEEGYALAINASVPDWFFEGDAVHQESILSKQGRGRLPLFLNAYPSLWLADKQYSWMKLRNGSLKDYVPNHYELGYLLVNYGYQQYGEEFWKKVTSDAAAFKGLFYPFQKAIERYTGKKYKQFREEALRFYQEKLQQEETIKKKEATEPLIASAVISPAPKGRVTNYLFPYAMAEDAVVVLKTSYNKRPRFIIKNGTHEEKTLRVRDISISDQFSYKNGKLVYAAYRNDTRWRWRNYSVLNILDIHTGKQKTLTHKTKYFTPDITSSGTTIVAVELPEQGGSSLVILNAATGKVSRKIVSPEVNVFTDPKFITETTVATIIRLRDGQSAVAIADITTGTLSRITPASFHAVGFPAVQGDTIFYSASFRGRDHIFFQKIGEAAVYQITEGELGEYYVNASKDKITWSSFSANGFQLHQADRNQLTAKRVSIEAGEMIQPLFTISEKTTDTGLLNNLSTDRQFVTGEYKKSTRLLNFHSWRPNYEDPLFTFSVYGQNVLNTLETELYYQYNENDQTNAAGLNMVYGKWFPFINAGLQYTFDRHVTSNNRTKQWAQLDSRIGASIPLSWVSGQTIKQLTMGTNYHYRNDFNRGFYKDTFTTINFGYLNHFITWSQQVEMAKQHIFPRWGYSLAGQYRYITNNYKSWQVYTAGTLYLPGLLPTHSVVLSGAYLETDTVNAAFGNIFSYPRGYNAVSFPTTASMWRLSANYHFPILYPDWGFANLFYIQRVRGNLFVDNGRVFSLNKLASANQRTVGGEIHFDTKWWNQHPLSFGFRLSYLLDADFYTGQKGVPVFEFIMPVNIIPR